MASRKSWTRGNFPDSCKSGTPSQLISTDFGKTKSLSCVLVELLLILIRSHTVSCHPRTTTASLPDSCIEILITDCIPTDTCETIAIRRSSEFVKLLLILIRSHSMSGNPCTSTAFLPDGSKSCSTTHSIGTDLDQTETLSDELIEFLLIPLVTITSSIY